MNDTLDRLFIQDLQFRCIIGINSDERREKQDVVAQITLWADLSDACRSDNIEDTVDYKTIKKNILKMAETSQFFLVEALAQSMADLCLQNERVEQVRIQVAKPTALRFARTVGVDITRRK
jgi:FolB domain-containing protein